MPVDICKPLRKFTPILIAARDDGLNEAGTVQRICRFFENVLGYDPFRDIGHEAEMKGKYVDVTIKIDDRVRLLVEVKAAEARLSDKHIEQAQAYASHNNYQWVLLTNGVDWNLYHLTFERGIEYERAFALSLADEGQFDDAATKLGLLHKKSLGKGLLDEYWEITTALRASSIGRALFQEKTLRVIRREIRHDTGILIDTEDLAKALRDMLPSEAWNIGPLKVRRRHKTTRPKPAEPNPTESKPEIP